jgi:hypothetical protein
LTNGTDGGDGVVNLPAESRERIRAAWIGRKHSEQTKRLIGKRTAERRHTDETKAKMSAAHSGRVFTPEWRAKISAALKGVRHAAHLCVTLEQAQEIKQRAEAGERHADLADEFKISKRTVWMIKSGRWFVRNGFAKDEYVAGCKANLAKAERQAADEEQFTLFGEIDDEHAAAVNADCDGE